MKMTEEQLVEALGDKVEECRDILDSQERSGVVITALPQINPADRANLQIAVMSQVNLDICLVPDMIVSLVAQVVAHHEAEFFEGELWDELQGTLIPTAVERAKGFREMLCSSDLSA